VGFYFGQPKANTCAVIILSNQFLEMPLVRWMDNLGKGEVLTSTDLDRFVNI